MFFLKGTQIAAFDQFHHKICRAVFFKKILNINNRDIPAKFLQRSCFFNKALFPIFKLTAIFFACQGNRAIRHSALNQIGRKILLDAAA